eukprot:GHVL01024425.1.p1 GENE.GHVL01024425.1~~GHVL01024425.1.p1  ORF type:complete len:322 (+),score=29.55 GHVL01024425.1:185-1150(+)
MFDEKGLINRKGQNNCFLNVVIQSLWNLRSFRQSFQHAPEHRTPCHFKRCVAKEAQINETIVRRMEVMKPYIRRDSEPSTPSAQRVQSERRQSSPGSPTSCLDESSKIPKKCAYCALKSIFANYEYGQDSLLPPDVLRMALSEAFESRGSFQLQQMEDADECIDSLLAILHSLQVQESSNSCDVDPFNDSETTCNPTCLSHEAFGIDLLDIVECSHCHAIGEPETLRAYLYRVYVSDVLKSGCDSLERCLRLLWEGLETRENRFWRSESYSDDTVFSSKLQCGTKDCQRSPLRRRFCTKEPMTFSVSLAWPNPEVSRSTYN